MGAPPRGAVVVARRRGSDMARHHDRTPGSALNMFIDAKEFVEQLPRRLNQIMETVADGRLRVEVDAVDEQELHRMAQKVANRVTAGLVIAAMVVGASMLMQVEVEQKL